MNYEQSWRIRSDCLIRFPSYDDARRHFSQQDGYFGVHLISCICVKQHDEFCTVDGWVRLALLGICYANRIQKTHARAGEDYIGGFWFLSFGSELDSCLTVCWQNLKHREICSSLHTRFCWSARASTIRFYAHPTSQRIGLLSAHGTDDDDDDAVLSHFSQTIKIVVHGWCTPSIIGKSDPIEVGDSVTNLNRLDASDMIDRDVPELIYR